MRLHITLVALLALAVVGCDSAGPDNEIGGLYVATGSGDGFTSRFGLDIPTTDEGAFTLGTDSEFSFTGGGGTSTIDLTGSGTYDHPNVSVTVRVSSDGTTILFTGTASDSGGSITLRGEGGNTSVFTRQ